MSRTVGYVRDLLARGDGEAEVKALRMLGASRVYVDRLDVSAARRPELIACLQNLQAGDTLLIPSAVMLSHSVEHFVSTVAQLRRREILMRSMTEPALSTAGGTGASIGDTLDALDGLRSRLIGIRTRQGMDAAILAGRKPGRPRVMTEQRIAVAQELRAQKRSYMQIGRALGVSEAAVRRALGSSAGHALPK
ncbi:MULTISPECIES: recombinase family protein [unclassified Microbacterium]|uniref:recombinase family protein n=1 Tax=unclassified Microbacterium TaxID=2609290 RepID=UPI0023BAD215|nr:MULTISPECIES: recombinase family protein [unclassified Microbacterium]